MDWFLLILTPKYSLFAGWCQINAI